jgi:hypothetical protein
MLQLTLRRVDVTPQPAPASKRLPRTSSVAQVAQLCARLFRMPVARVRLALLRKGGEQEALGEAGRDLHWLGAESGDELLVRLSE